MERVVSIPENETKRTSTWGVGSVALEEQKITVIFPVSKENDTKDQKKESQS